MQEMTRDHAIGMLRAGSAAGRRQRKHNRNMSAPKHGSFVRVSGIGRKGHEEELSARNEEVRDRDKDKRQRQEREASDRQIHRQIHVEGSMDIDERLTRAMERQRETDTITTRDKNHSEQSARAHTHTHTHIHTHTHTHTNSFPLVFGSFLVFEVCAQGRNYEQSNDRKIERLKDRKTRNTRKGREGDRVKYEENYC